MDFLLCRQFFRFCSPLLRGDCLPAGFQFFQITGGGFVKGKLCSVFLFKRFFLPRLHFVKLAAGPGTALRVRLSIQENLLAVLKLFNLFPHFFLLGFQFFQFLHKLHLPFLLPLRLFRFLVRIELPGAYGGMASDLHLAPAFAGPGILIAFVREEKTVSLSGESHRAVAA